MIKIFQEFFIFIVLNGQFRCLQNSRDLVSVQENSAVPGLDAGAAVRSRACFNEGFAFILLVGFRDLKIWEEGLLGLFYFLPQVILFHITETNFNLFLC